MDKLLIAVSLTLIISSCAKIKSFCYEGFNRDKWQYPQKVIESLNIKSGDQVVDIGAGGGYFTFKLADAVDGEGKVYAVDVDEDMTKYLQGLVRKRGYSNIEVILGKFDDPLLPDSVADLIFICNTYHHIGNRVDYFSRLKSDLKQDGRVAIVELKPGGWLSKLFRSHFTEKSAIMKEMESAGYSLLISHDYLPKQHFVIFTPKGD
jgi:ubiquinone/menaquinone biosynthesis C-methylase UbiE